MYHTTFYASRRHRRGGKPRGIDNFYVSMYDKACKFSHVNRQSKSGKYLILRGFPVNGAIYRSDGRAMGDAKNACTRTSLRPMVYLTKIFILEWQFANFDSVLKISRLSKTSFGQFLCFVGRNSRPAILKLND